MKLEENITEYLNTQGVTACKRFKIKKDGDLIETNTLLLTFNTTLPKSLKKILPNYTGRSLHHKSSAVFQLSEVWTS